MNGIKFDRPQGMGGVGTVNGTQAPTCQGSKGRQATGATAAPQFAELLQQMVGETKATVGLKVSAHAERRLREREINLTPGDWREIGRAVELAASKGVRSTLVLYGDLALVASVPNRTVVTAMAGTEASKHVFTNIDGAIIVKRPSEEGPVR